MKRLIRKAGKEILPESNPLYSNFSDLMKDSNGREVAFYLIENSSVGSDGLSYSLEIKKPGENEYLAWLTAETEDYGDDEEYLSMTMLDVNPQYQSRGVGEYLFRKFSEYYNQYHKGKGIDIATSTPTVEYLTAKMVQEGLLPEEAFAENFEGRPTESYKNWLHGDGQQTIKDLRNKLPQDFRNKFSI